MKTEQNLKPRLNRKNEIAEAILSGLPKVVIDALEAELKTLEKVLDDLQANPEECRP